MEWRGRITLDPRKRHGQPCIRDLRITVGDILQMFASGMSEEEILEEFPTLSRDDIRAALAYAAERERKTVVHPGA